MMKFILKPSLEHMAVVKIVVYLWNQNDVRILIAKHNFRDCDSSQKWKTIEERVMEKVPKLLLPPLLKEQMLGFIKPIGLQIKGWVNFHCIHFRLCVNFPAELCWTPQGTVDRKRTAEMLVKDESLDMSARYELACMYCMEHYIHKFWNSMSEDLKESVPRSLSPVIVFWTNNMKGIRDFSFGHNDWEYELGHSLYYGNKVALEYFLQKLNPQRREEFLMGTAKSVEDADKFCFLLEKLEEVQQMEVFQYNPYGVLKCFLQWPFQSFFIGMANCMWDFMSRNDVDFILRTIIDKVRDGFKDWNYQKLFREFWQKSPSALKSLITNDIDKSDLLPSLFRIKDKGNIQLILKDTPLTVKENLIYNYRMNLFVQSSIRDNEWDLLEFFIRECFPSKTAMLKYKEELESCMIHSNFEKHFAAEKHKWEQLFQ